MKYVTKKQISNQLHQWNKQRKRKQSNDINKLKKMNKQKNKIP